MPFGKKQVNGGWVDFDDTWNLLFKPAAAAVGFDAERVDEDFANGHISENMIRKIKDADVVVVDVTYHNPNVYYELGMRHALVKHGTVLTKRSNSELPNQKQFSGGVEQDFEMTEIPFDLRQMAHAFYELADDKRSRHIENLSKTIVARFDARNTDSPVFAHVPKLRISEGLQKASGAADRLYHILDGDRDSPQRTGVRIGYRRGDLANLTADSDRSVDYWASSENTLMQMARIYENAVSATVRYLGGLDPATGTQTDRVFLELTKKMGNRPFVPEAHVIETGSHFLKQTHGVKALLHVAAVTGSPREGFRPIASQNLANCVTNSINAARRIIRTGDARFTGRSLIMPLFGTGQAKGDPAFIAGQLVFAAIECMRHTPKDLEGRDLDLVLFSAYSVDDVRLMQKMFAAYCNEGDLEPTSK